MMQNKILCPAKINLFLHVLNKRVDGYHNLESLVAFADIGDELSFAGGEKGLFLTMSGTYAGALEGNIEDNLIIKATRAFERYFNLKVNGRFVLGKNLPVAAGIGGGSSNAAGAIKLLMQYYEVSAASTGFDAMLLSLGADVPVCFKAQTCIMAGIGEQLSVWQDIPKLYAVLINPNRAISTAKIFSNLELVGNSAEYRSFSPKFTDLGDYIEFLTTKTNDMQTAAIKICPEIADVLENLNRIPEVLLSRMSGSGATCFALFTTEQAAKQAANALSLNHSNWWVKTCCLA